MALETQQREARNWSCSFPVSRPGVGVGDGLVLELSPLGSHLPPNSQAWRPHICSVTLHTDLSNLVFLLHQLKPRDFSPIIANLACRSRPTRI